MKFTLPILCCLIGLSAFAQIKPDTTLFQKFYKIGEDQEIFIPLGKMAFADTVIAFNPGNPKAQKPFRDAQNSLGEPDFTTYRTNDPKYVSIGCGGSLTVKFIDNGFIDIEGPDLYFFEIGPSVEPFRLEISEDGEKWMNLGHVSGGTSSVDIGRFVNQKGPRRIYYYVRITDLKHFCGGPTPGSDIDAIGAIGAVIKLSLEAKLLFDTDKFFLRDRSKESLEKLERQMSEIPKAKFIIKGYTDSDGTDGYNMVLGKNRAKTVRNYLKKHLKKHGDYSYKIKSYGKTNPVSENSTEDGKQKNRRVEIIVIPDKDFYKIPEKKK